MPGKIVTLRDAVYDAIVAAKTGYTVNNCDVIKSYCDVRELKELVTPQIAVKGLAFGEMRIDRSADYQIPEIPIQVGIIKKVTDFTVVDEIDDLVDTFEEVMATCRNDFNATSPKFQWVKSTVIKKDTDELPFDFTMLVNQGVFLTVFTAFYTTVA